MPDKPVICIGWPTIARLACGESVELGAAVLIPDDLLFNTAAERKRKSAREAVDAIIADLNDRRGLKGEWQQIDPDTQKQIGEAWERILCGERP